jgi:hypothetical protein
MTWVSDALGERQVRILLLLQSSKSNTIIIRYNDREYGSIRGLARKGYVDYEIRDNYIYVRKRFTYMKVLKKQL